MKEGGRRTSRLSQEGMSVEEGLWTACIQLHMCVCYDSGK